MKFRTLVLAVVLSLSAVTNCQMYSDIDSVAKVKVGEDYVVPIRTNSDVDVLDGEEADYVLEPIEVSDVVKVDNNEQEPLLYANVYEYDDYVHLQLPSEKVDVVEAGVNVQDFDLSSVKAAADDGSQLAENVEINSIKLADANAANIQSLVEGKSLDLLTDWKIGFTEGTDDVDLEEAMRNWWWNNLADSDESESGESEESDESGSGGGDDSESDESDDDDDGEKYGFNVKIPSFGNMAQWVQAVKQQQLIDTEAAALGDNNDVLGDNKHDYFTEISETDSASSGSDASKQVEPSVDIDFDARVNPEGQVDGGYNKPTFDNKQQNPTNVVWANVEPELKELSTDSDSQKFEKHNVIESVGRPLHVYSAFHYVFFAISGTLFILGLMVIVGAIIRNMRYKQPSYIIMVEAGMNGKM